MKQFFKFMFASMAGMLLMSVIVFFLGLFIISGLISSADKETTVEKNSLLELKFDYPIKERTSKNPFEDMNFGSFASERGLGLNDILKNIEKAKRDERIKGIFLNLSGMMVGIASLEEIRIALIDFKTSKKPVYAYSEGYTQGSYYLASVADKIYLNPQGELDWRGLRTELMFFKGALEKLEIEPEVIRHGRFKSAVEPYINDKMSADNKIQISTLVNSIWQNLVSNIAKSRNISDAELMAFADNLAVRTPEDALKNKMVDKLAYYDEVQSDLKKIAGIDEKEKLKLTDAKKYDKAYVKAEKSFSNKKIAVIYAVGPIGGGDGDDNSIGSDKISSTIRKARQDSTIKAIVLRVNSPGGSALASDVIWREVMLAKKDKPVVVSMGDVAASGGYYISCAADTIVAEPTTITGSIGVFGLLFNTQKLFNNKLGITFDTVKTGKFANIGSSSYPLTAQERDIIQQEVERIYDTFTSRVSEGRNISKADVDSMGQGRVWSGTDAKRLGLVDVLGDINTAIDIAAKMAKLDNYRTIALPEPEDILKKLLEDFSAESEARILEKNLGVSYKYYQHLQSVLNTRGIQARLPYELEIY